MKQRLRHITLMTTVMLLAVGMLAQQVFAERVFFNVQVLGGNINNEEVNYHDIEVEPTDTVAEVINKLAEKGYDMTGTVLCFDGKPMDESKTLSDYNVGNEDWILVDLNIRYKANLMLTKTWDDNSDAAGKRPSADDFKQYIKLLADGTEFDLNTEGVEIAITDNGDNTYTVEIDGLPKLKNGREIAYTVEEKTIPNYTAGEVSASNIYKNRKDYSGIYDEELDNDKIEESDEKSYNFKYAVTNTYEPTPPPADEEVTPPEDEQTPPPSDNTSSEDENTPPPVINEEGSTNPSDEATETETQPDSETSGSGQTTKVKSVETGDSARIGGIVLILVMAAAALGVFIRRRIKE